MTYLADNLWDQIDRLKQFKDSNFVTEKVKNSLRSFISNYFDLDSKQFQLDRKRIRILERLVIRLLKIQDK